ncbi:hypothetical protein CYLTODRAFT_351740 [Cylindrobasidium torrendii FP15055 ss-10]|uniref:Tetraspanin Tsp2 n=1 Tax=Cylindrobasidium torrendii FP15055 ss-10 TaxID=1314674 RepID=A0A0D7BF40_9AGAR|nr:hypothetical protein CYLTODRAFT_351740 [Cylindrobasidium torrendii FP15055 ss-10]
MNDVREWPRMKWSLLFSILTVLTYGSFATYVCLATWFRTWMHADVMYVVDYDILVLISFCGCILLFTSIIGITGLILNSRPILAVYALLLWPALMSMLAIGYTSYKRHAYALDHKLSFFWSQYFTPLGRLLIQNSLHCCGFYSPLHDAVPSRRCFPRTGLPGCKSKLWRFERTQLATVWQTTFALVAVHLMNIVVSLLCANHVTETFGKGVMPRQYRLTKADVRQLEMQMRRPEYSRASSSLTFREDKR